MIEDESAWVDGSDKLTGRFGYWPSFHDAEVLRFELKRGRIAPAENVWEMPEATVVMHLWEMTDRTDEAGFLVLQKQTLATFRFSGIDRLQLNGFNHRNAVFELILRRKTREDGPSPYYDIRFEPAFGIEASFECLRIELLEAVACDAQGRVLPR